MRARASAASCPQALWMTKVNPGRVEGILGTQAHAEVDPAALLACVVHWPHLL